MAKKLTVTFDNPTVTTNINHMELWRKVGAAAWAVFNGNIAFVAGTHTYSQEDTNGGAGFADGVIVQYEARSYNNLGGDVEGTDYEKIAVSWTVGAIAAPTSLTVGTPTSTTIPLTWTKSITGVMTAYRVYDDGVLLQTFSGDVAAGTLTGLTASTTYTNLTVRAYNGTSESANSNAVNGTTTSGVSYTTIYTSNFTAGADGFTGYAATVDGNIDGIGGQNDVLRFYPLETTATHYIMRNNIPVGTYKVTLDYFIPSAQTKVSGFFIGDGTGVSLSFVTPVSTPAAVYDTWTTRTFDIVSDVSGFSLAIMGWSTQNNSGHYTGDNISTSNLIYLKNVLVEKQN